MACVLCGSLHDTGGRRPDEALPGARDEVGTRRGWCLSVRDFHSHGRGWLWLVPGAIATSHADPPFATAGADCEQQCYNANGKAVDCTSKKCVEGKDCNPPTKTKTTEPPATTDLLGESGSTKAPSALAETGVPTGNMLFVAFGFLAAGGGLALVARRRGGRQHH